MAVETAEYRRVYADLMAEHVAANRAANAAEDRLVAAIRALGPDGKAVNLGHKLIALGPNIVPFGYPDALDLEGSRVLDFTYADGQAVGIPGGPSGHDPAAARPTPAAWKHAGPYEPKIARKIRPHVEEMWRLQAEVAGPG